MNLLRNITNASFKKAQVTIVLLLSLSFILITAVHDSRAEFASTSSAGLYYVTSFADDPGLVLYLPLLEGQGSMALDMSGFKNNGLLYPNGNISWLANGGIHFNGVNNSVFINGSASLQNAYKTVIIKFMWDGKTSNNAMNLYDDGWANNGSMIMYVHPPTSRIYVEFITKNGAHEYLWHPIVANQVYVAIFSFDGFNYNFWLANNNWLDTAENSGSFEQPQALQTNYNINIGSNFYNTGNYFSGDIYDVQIFNRALSSNEVSGLLAMLRGDSRTNPSSKYVIGGSIFRSNASFDFPLQPIQVYLNQTTVTSPDEYGVFRFAFDLPNDVGSHTYSVTINNNTGGGTLANVLVDRVTVVDSGSSTVIAGEKATAWFKLASEYDGQPIDSGIVYLTGGLNAAWNADKSRWEYSEVRNEAGTLTLHVESVSWAKYGITALSPSLQSSQVIMEWLNPPWYTVLLPWLSGIGPALFGIIGILAFLAVLIRFGFIRVSTEELSNSDEQLRKEIDDLLQSSNRDDKESDILRQFLQKLLDDNPPKEVLDFLKTSLPKFIEDLKDQSNN